MLGATGSSVKGHLDWKAEGPERLEHQQSGEGPEVVGAGKRGGTGPRGRAQPLLSFHLTLLH